MFEDEEWADIPGYPNYMVSTFGRIYNAKHERFIQPFEKFGYDHVMLYRNGRRVNKKIHRLVADAFIPKRFGANEVNHDDGDKHYNDVANLEWSTRSENMKHAFETGLKSATNKHKIMIVETGERFDSITECADAIGGYISAISRCLSNPGRKHRGLTFQYVEEAFE